MASFRFLLFLQLSIILVAAQETVQWSSCSNKYSNNTPIDCGSLLVPLDYTESASNTTYQLDLLRVPAPMQPAKGSIVINFGGPGEGGQSTLALEGATMLALSGYQYDLVSFDPRGLPSTSLPFVCFDTLFEEHAFMAEQTAPDIGDEDALRRLWTQSGILADACAQKNNVTGTLVGTAFAARDVKSISDVLNGDGTILYWGFSYGTTLGSTLVSMFPDQIAKVILDGVQNPHEYYNSLAGIQQYASTDAEFSKMFSDCIASSDACPLAQNNPNATAVELELKVLSLFDDLSQHPIAIGEVLVDDYILYQMSQNALYVTRDWASMMSTYDNLLTGRINETAFLDQARQVVSIDNTSLISLMAAQYPLYAIQCSDQRVHTDSLDDLLPTLEKVYQTSKVLGRLAPQLVMPCAQWKLEPKERYTGDFQVSPKSPVLLIGNTYDGHTPLESAYNVSSGFEDSVVLAVNGSGHTSYVLPSVCSLRAMANYWVNGTLPSPGTVCSVDAPPYGNVNWTDIIEMIS